MRASSTRDAVVTITSGPAATRDAPRPPRATVVVDDHGIARCAWSAGDQEYQRYHDTEWGVPLHGDRPLFEKLSLEGFQSGLSWLTILRRRPTFRRAFSDFDINVVAEMGAADVSALMLDSGIIRNRAKIEATISNARITRALVDDKPGALDLLLWSFAPGPGARPSTWAGIPPFTEESTAMSAALRSLGYRFVGPTTLHALMQSAGMVDDHFDGCWRADPPRAGHQ